MLNEKEKTQEGVSFRDCAGRLDSPLPSLPVPSCVEMEKKKIKERVSPDLCSTPGHFHSTLSCTILLLYKARRDSEKNYHVVRLSKEIPWAH
jgi:hypothetical protein